MASFSSHTSEKRRPVPAPSNPVLLAIQSQWLFTDEELTRTPSQLDGMKLEAENTSRSKGVNFITQVGIMLKLPQLTLATAAVYLHRFFMRFSMVDLPQRPGMHPYPIAATSLFLATKVEENVRRMREIVVACCRVAQKQPNLVVDEQSKDFWRWRDTILHHEDMVLEAICFDLQLEQPYRILYDFICFFGVSENKPLRNAAWAFVNDSMFTVLCLQFTARTIAAAALYAAARHCDVGFQDDDSDQPWWEQIDVDLTQVRRACTRMAQLYENNAMQKHSQYYPTTPIISDEGTEKTRIPRAGSPANTPREAHPVNGQKRSREPEDEARGRSESQNPLDSQDPHSDRSPKRQRRGSDAPAPPDRPPSEKTSISPSQSSSARRRSSQSHTNGHLPPPPAQHRHPHPLPPAPRPYSRRDSDSRPGSNPAPGASVDPIQQRIDEIVQQNMSHGAAPAPPTSSRDPPRSERRSSDRYRGDWEHEDHHPDRRRRPSDSGSSSRKPPPPPSSDHHHPHQHQQPPPPPPDHLNDSQPPPPPPPPPSQSNPHNPEDKDDEGGGSEEGEL
ncbi:cyclin-like protein [Aspergillus steynii IBT 23096]|uniref:RNA polymerase II holoenzyme cyclin-like subunit n=1 Tax=Aspergillus steynii IBT 23096 TaxID=1392250 RepID=A0A2I2GJH1_9EURO|nr:cyclin-like protein [Aspergillus steynii IBT 23096]PLB53020.1 cyclin-like protein [Aspergillus steynii IBT 23096]